MASVQPRVVKLLIYAAVFMITHECCICVCLWRRRVPGSLQPPPSRACCCVWLIWPLPWLRPDRLSAHPTGTDTQNCEYHDTRDKKKKQKHRSFLVIHQLKCFMIIMILIYQNNICVNYSFFLFLRYESFGGSGDGKSLHSVTFKPGQRVTLAWTNKFSLLT